MILWSFPRVAASRPLPLTCLSLCVLLLVGSLAFAHDGPHEEAPPATRVLGQLSFPTSTDSKTAHRAFVRGMLLLHLFEYDFAATEFREAQALDPTFVLAYWGEAMVHNHPLWGEQDRQAGLAVLEKLAPTAAARRALAATPLEGDFLASLEVLYGDGAKAERDERYRAVLAEMAQRYPDDHEVQLFYALALMGEGAGVRDVPAYMEAAALAQRVFVANRKHPGAAHYLIHAVDDPIHAPLGLDAARALGAMAPDAGHSLHMTSHIFTALGMWSDVVSANQQASRVANAMAQERGRSPRAWGHYNFWLLYGLLQQGRHDEALALLTAAYRESTTGEVPAAPKMQLDADRSQVGSTVQMWARYLIETRMREAQEVSAFTFALGDAHDPILLYHYVRAFDAQSAAQVAEHLTLFMEQRRALHDDLAGVDEVDPWDQLFLQRLEVMQRQLQALLARAEGDTARMLTLARAASELEGEMPYSYGPPFVDYPSAELLGEWLLDLERYDEAAAAFREQLLRSRNRVQALDGLARAERGRGDEAAAEMARARYQRARTEGKTP